MSQYQPIPEPVMMSGSPQLGPSPMDFSRMSTHQTPQFTPGQNFQIVGKDSQLLFFNLKPGEEVIMQPGSMVHYVEGLEAEVQMGNFCACCAGGEDMFKAIYRNVTGDLKSISVAPLFPSKIIPVRMDQHPMGLTVKKGGFVAADSRNVQISARMVTSLGMALGSGGNLFMLNIAGSGTVFLDGGGTVMSKMLGQGEVILFDQKALVACSNSCNLSIRRSGDCMMMLCGGLGLVVTEVTGPGLVIFQSMPLELAASLYMPRGGGGGGGGGGGDGGGGGG